MTVIYAPMGCRVTRDKVQSALNHISDEHPVSGIAELEAVLDSLAPGSPDAKVVGQALDRLEEIADAISAVEILLSEHAFSFGRVEA